jgi:hypothetical protein
MALKTISAHPGASLPISHGEKRISGAIYLS